MYRLKLNKKGKILAIILLIISSYFIINLSIKENKKTIEECERQFNHSCNSSELNYFYKNVK